MITLKFWAEPVSVEDNAKLCRVITAAAQYRRQLNVIENDCRSELSDLGREYPGVAPLLQQLALLHQLPDKSTEIQRVREELRALARQRRDDPAYQERARAITAQHHARKLRAYAQSGLGRQGPLSASATADMVYEAHDQACHNRKWPELLNTHAALDEGALEVRDKQGRSITREVLLAGTWSGASIGRELYARGRKGRGFADRTSGENDCGRSGQRGAARLRELRFRVWSEQRVPVYARLHVLLHREIPEGDIKRVRVHRQRVGRRYKWSLQMVIDATARAAVTPEAKAIGIDMGAGRRVPGGYRLAYASGTDGYGYDLVIPELTVETRGDRAVSRGVVHEHDKAADLSSIRKLRFNDTVTRLRAYVETLSGDHWLRGELVHAHAWKRAGRLVKLHRLWRDTRFVGDDEAFAQLDADLKQDRHLWDWETGSRTKQERRIRGRVEQWCAAICDRYEVIIIEKLSVAALKELGNGYVARKIQVFAPGRLLEILRRFAKARGRAVFEVNPAYTSIDCAACGFRRYDIEDKIATLLHCSNCGVTEDRDRNASKNILRRGLAEGRSLDDKPAKKPRKRGTRRAADSGARNLSDNSAKLQIN